MKHRSPPPRDAALFQDAVGELEGMSREELAAAKSDNAFPQRRSAPDRLRRDVRRGGIEPVATLDLHGLDRRTALARVRRFLRTQAAPDPRLVLIVHGRGTEVLAEAVSRELERNRLVAEHFPAPRRLGGAGARVARLKGEGPA